MPALLLTYFQKKILWTVKTFLYKYTVSMRKNNLFWGFQILSYFYFAVSMGKFTLCYILCYITRNVEWKYSVLIHDTTLTFMLFEFLITMDAIASIKWNIMSVAHETPKGGICKFCLTEKFWLLVLVMNIYWIRNWSLLVSAGTKINC